MGAERSGAGPVADSVPPFRSPPCRDYVFFSEAARSIAVCIELNGREGLFSAPSNPRVSSLAVVEAIGNDGAPCDVRLIGRVVDRVSGPSPLVRVRWLRAVCPGVPARLFHVLDLCYGFWPGGRKVDTGPGEFRFGTEYDFSQQSITARSPDSARGDTSRFARRGPQPAPLRRGAAGPEEIEALLGMSTTQTIRVDVRKTPDGLKLDIPLRPPTPGKQGPVTK